MLVGVLTVLGSAFGWFGARFQPRLLAVYLAIGSIATILQLIVLLTIFLHKQGLQQQYRQPAT